MTGSSGGKFAVKRNHRYVRNFKGGDHDKNRDVCLTIKKKQSVGLLGNSRVKHALHAAIPLKNKTWFDRFYHSIHAAREISGEIAFPTVCVTETLIY